MLEPQYLANYPVVGDHLEEKSARLIREDRLNELLRAEARLAGERGMTRFLWGVMLVTALLAFVAGLLIGRF
jgi:hypothetical protein